MPVYLNLFALTISSTLLFSACATHTASTPGTASPSSIAATLPQSNATDSPKTATAHSGGAKQGGQVVEMGDYHLELLAIPEGKNVHVDFWLLTGADHGAITDANITANLQFPNGTQKNVEMTYDKAGQHYKAFVPGYVPGQYRVVVQTDIKGEKVNGRFNFSL
jgi:hypothetical protein